MKTYLLGMALLASATSAQAENLFTDGFDGENGGNSALNYTGFANFTVTGGVDLVANGAFGLTCGSPGGSCVDLAGTPGPGRLTSLASFAFAAGDTVTFSLDLSGNQRPGAGSPTDDYALGINFSGNISLANYGYNYFGSDVNLGPSVNSGFSVGGGIAASTGYLRRSVFFTANQAGSLTFFVGSTTNDDFGPIIDNVSLDRVAAATGVPEPMSWAMMVTGFGLVGGALRRRAAPAAIRFA